MTGKDDLKVVHGSMTLSVPRDLFRGQDAEFVPDKVMRYRDIIGHRYPWLSENALDVIMQNARKEMLRVMDEESGGISGSRRLSARGRDDLAIMHLEERLKEHPDDTDSWYALGELLCKAGRTEEGYAALRKGRSLIRE